MRSSSSKDPAVGNDIFRNLLGEDVEDGSRFGVGAQRNIEKTHVFS